MRDDDNTSIDIEDLLMEFLVYCKKRLEKDSRSKAPAIKAMGMPNTGGRLIDSAALDSQSHMPQKMPNGYTLPLPLEFYQAHSHGLTFNSNGGVWGEEANSDVAAQTKKTSGARALSQTGLAAAITPSAGVSAMITPIAPQAGTKETGVGNTSAKAAAQAAASKPVTPSETTSKESSFARYAFMQQEAAEPPQGPTQPSGALTAKWEPAEKTDQVDWQPTPIFQASCGYEGSKHYLDQNEMEFINHLYSEINQKILPLARSILDQYEFEGSPVLDGKLDKESLGVMIDKVLDLAATTLLEVKEMDMANGGWAYVLLRATVETLLLIEIYGKRKPRYRVLMESTGDENPYWPML